MTFHPKAHADGQEGGQRAAKALPLDPAFRPGQLTEAMPAIGSSLFLIAIGAILRFAVTATLSWLSIPTVDHYR